MEGKAQTAEAKDWRKRLGVEPSPPAKRGATDFEDREGHRAPFASVRPPRTPRGSAAQVQDSCRTEAGPDSRRNARKGTGG